MSQGLQKRVAGLSTADKSFSALRFARLPRSFDEDIRVRAGRPVFPKVAPFDWCHAELDEIRAFLQKEESENRFRKVTNLPW